jgi:hypothetical protein
LADGKKNGRLPDGVEAEVEEYQEEESVTLNFLIQGPMAILQRLDQVHGYSPDNFAA